jgi:hypothetical protein
MRKVGSVEANLKPALKSADWKTGDVVIGFLVEKKVPSEKVTSEMVTLVGSKANKPTKDVTKLWVVKGLERAFADPTVKPGMLLRIECTGTKVNKQTKKPFPIFDVGVETDKSDKDVVFDIEKLKQIVGETETTTPDDLTEDWD